MSSTRPLFAAVAGALVVLSSRVALAQGATDASRAEKLFTEASALAEAGKYDEACPKFAASQRLDGGLGTQFNLALCYERQGKLGSAWRNYRAVEHLAHQTGKTSREEAAIKQMAGLRSRVSRLVITIPDADATVKVDGEVVPQEDWSFYAVDAGEHTVEASAPTKKTVLLHVMVDKPSPNGDGIERRVAVPALKILSKTDVRIVTRSNPKKTIGFIVGGVGILGLGAGLATGIALLNDRSIADDRCTPRCSDQSAIDAVATGKTLIPINVIAWGVGIAGVGVGSYLLFTSRDHTTSAFLTPTFGQGGGGMNVAGRF